MKKLIAPSILSADFSKLGDEIRSVEDAEADWIHVDVMDGHFVPNITMGPVIVKAASSVTSLPIDVHLMIKEPDRYITDFAKAGTSLISVHIETCVHANRTIQLIKESGCRAGIALNPSTALSSIDWVLEYVDLVVIMSVNPGFGGQTFITNTLEKIRTLRSMIDGRNLSTMIEIDGGVCEENIEDISIAGSDVFVAGSAIFGSPDYKKTIAKFRKRLKEKK
ncbi:MAG: ribulose-phosphate 3-epimerase [Desulfobacterales bacterium]|uniref:Ribulose-phosphate 3-epimerase n=1 Tax=Candidatus Desulfaltia bathyphila TaxID=2841697 RepID=A0A8J6TBH2_9BACT|nr:ribulose-phosphate 3-epimerase [Candidatus Desulfaltia bathyphila]MBL7195869.1 ribulose-phosphate 3-epimerase [Desulfobacterales bacterium]MBL7207367.1 ribulose-phosphate 3-epimerase [Desulfobacterales bacterium]